MERELIQAARPTPNDAAFWEETEIGVTMAGTVKLWDANIRLRRPYQQISVFMARFEAFQICIKQFYGMDVYFERNKDFIAICDANGAALWKANR